MNKFSRKLILFIVVIIVIAVMIRYAKQPKPVKVSVKPVTVGKVENTVTNTRAGTIRSCKRARLAPAIAGQISRLLVTEGDKVEAGALLLEIWNDDIKAEMLLSEQETRATKSRSREACVTADVAERNGLGDVIEFLADDERLVEGYRRHAHLVSAVEWISKPCPLNTGQHVLEILSVEVAKRYG